MIKLKGFIFILAVGLIPCLAVLLASTDRLWAYPVALLMIVGAGAVLGELAWRSSHPQ